MGLSTFTTILLFLVCLVGGVAIGFLLGRYLRPTPELPPLQEQENNPPVVKEPASTPPPDPALLRVGRTRKKELWLEMDGQHWETGAELPPGNRKELSSLVHDLGPWLESPPAPLPGPEAYVPKPAKNSIFSRTFSPARKVEEKPPLPVKVDLLTNPASMVIQIDAILQRKLLNSPFSTLDIHLLESPTGEVYVQVGALKHPGVDSIPNPEIQALIHQAVAEWESITQ